MPANNSEQSAKPACEKTSEGGLVDFIAGVVGEDHLKVEENLGDGFVRLRTAEAQRRQAKHDIRWVEDIVIEMLRNARDAHASRIFLATTRDEEKKARYLTFIDDGDGIPSHMHRLIFEPRVTSKLETMVVDSWGVHGRGMALYSISENTRRSFVVSSAPGLGSSIFVDVDVDELSERRDQSTLPSAARGEDGAMHVLRGPHNIARQVIEFSIEQPAVSVYLGSPAEVASSLYGLGKEELSASELLFCDDVSKLPVCYRLAAAGSADELSELAEGLGLPISLRTAHRIIAGQIKALRPALLSVLPASKAERPCDVMKDRRGLKISHSDISDFQLDLERSFEGIAEKYYLSLKDMPKVTVSHDAIRVRFDIEKAD